MLYDLGAMKVLKGISNEILTWFALMAVGAGILFLAVTCILLIGKLVRFAWGW